jgi:UPF0042 nucleotide-binding protein
MTQTVIQSFGYLHGDPPNDLSSPIVLDVRRTFHNPMHDPDMVNLTGLDIDVYDHVVGTSGAEELVQAIAKHVAARLDKIGPGRPRVDVAIGCAGGRHRSVALAVALSNELTYLGVETEVEHRDIDKPVVRSKTA